MYATSDVGIIEGCCVFTCVEMTLCFSRVTPSSSTANRGLESSRISGEILTSHLTTSSGLSYYD